MNFTIELTASPALLEAINNLTLAFQGNPTKVANNVTVEEKKNTRRTTKVDLPPVTQTETNAPDTAADNEPVPVPTIEIIRAAVREKGMSGKKDEAKALLTQFGVERVPDLPETVRAEFLSKVEAL
jgi:hypothetical protein